MREMYFSSQPMEMVDNKKALEVTFEMIKAETQLRYSSDYPHWDMDLPSTIFDQPFIHAQSKRNILGANAQRLFNLEPVLSPVKLARKAARERAPAAVPAERWPADIAAIAAVVPAKAGAHNPGRFDC